MQTPYPHMLCHLIILDKDNVVRFHSLWHVKTLLVLEQQLSIENNF